ncbi:efflux transporter periplasmic adaptor subunit [Christiangramia salexigens]|uniref:Efflux transporter periplasmic adaptor subunit n=2 Tax=Christiangramia salexigens TaxID=1913577 RepID=A0A1L3J8L5_9FLAO|nr:efflux transporter periplasmic adaptor subunit [Christiangramia salexigens]
MKNYFLLAGLLSIFISCGTSEEKSVDEIIQSNDLSEIRAKKNELSNTLSEVSKEIAKLDEAIQELDTSNKFALVALDTIKSQLFKHYAEVQGNVATDENIIIYPEYSGILTRVTVKEGDKVTKGQTLAVIDDGGLSSQLAQLEAQARLAKTTYERQERLWNQNIGSEIQYLEAKTNYEALESSVQQLKSQIAKTVVRAPFSGVIDDVLSEQGEVVNPGQNQLFRLINLDKMYVEAEVPENYLGKVKKGTEVKVNLSSIAKEFKGEVSQVSNNINPNNRTFRIKVALPNEKGLVKPNQIATIKLNDYTSETAVVIPENIIQKNAMGESIVYVYTPKEGENTGIAKKSVVETGYIYKDSIEVKTGLNSGDILITDGAKNLRDGQEVRIKTSGGNE